ncbi:MAG: hypothetical protein FK730_07330 [Asgard group archaeon]|nr:hypothetical protein [Asgard group archaeon]
MKEKKIGDFNRLSYAKYILIDEDGNEREIKPRPDILYDDSVLIVTSRLDRKIYAFIGKHASARKQFSANKITLSLREKLGYQIDWIRFPSDDISSEHMQFIDYLVDYNYLQELKIDRSKYYTCYFCGEPLERDSKNCPSCKKEIPYCIVCKLPISFGDDLGKCSLCEGIAHYIHFHEWIKIMSKCPKCQQKIPIEGIVPITHLIEK